MSCMHSNLVCAPGAEVHVEQRRELREMLDRLEGRGGLLAIGMNAYDALASLLQIRLERQIDGLGTEGPASADERVVALLHFAFAHCSVQFAKHRTPFRDQQAAAGIAIQPVHQIQFLQFRVTRPQRLDHAE